MFYAQVSDEGICFAVTQTAGMIEQAGMIEIASYDESLLGKKRVGAIWEDMPVVPIPEPEPQPSQENRIAQLEAVIDTLLGGGAE